VEAIFKCFARAMRFACSTDARLKDQLPSTKGLLEGTRGGKKKPKKAARAKARA
jgi:hypothetical protein